MSTAKKRHHYVPITYLKAFCRKDGMLTVYRKDGPEKPFRTAPESTAFHNYYAQPLPSGGESLGS